MKCTLSTKECIYHRFLALGWEFSQGIEPSTVTPISANMLANLISENTDDRPILINCEGMSLCIDHSMSEVSHVLEKTERSLILTVPQHDSNFENKLFAELGHPIDRYNIDGTLALCYGKDSVNFNEDYIQNSLKSISVKETEFVQEKVSSCYRRFNDKPHRLTSTPLIANGVFNARGLISDKKTFMWISLLLAEKIRKRIMETYPENIFILAISLRGSPLAAAIWNILRQHDPYIEIIDHIGPVHELLEDAYDPLGIIGKNYFLIGDFILGGTELKIANAYAINHQSTLNSAVFIGSLLNGDDYSVSANVESLVKLTDCVRDLHYSI